MQKIGHGRKSARKKLKLVQRKALRNGLSVDLLKNFNYIYHYEDSAKRGSSLKLAICVAVVFTSLVISASYINSILGIRCLLPSNYLVWEATRPLANCSYCTNVTRPVILRNISQLDFKRYAYSSKPIIVKNAISKWKATKEFNYDMFKRLYEETEGSYESLDEGCQFLNFKTDLFSLKEVFSMPRERVENKPGEKPWYVGWGNCHPDILRKVRRYYSIPDFLPDDAEFPATENIFFGYEIGAVMHLDYIPRLMWQGQVHGNKIWSVAPVPECEHVCGQLQYYVEPGDVVLLDTRLWYHSTRIPKGEFSLTVQSEYG